MSAPLRSRMVLELPRLGVSLALCGIYGRVALLPPGPRLAWSGNPR